ncbi:MAG: GtrA family protein [Clostridia bacterium]|jgi:putative flippase GtrA|nr:GtrA family protein [Clostridia bacterium]MBQ4366112.1 GtrA family protein [Clostridia bacterium]MBQ6093478.1 GtrA family protein [Clostridia bacterium]
MEEKKTFTQSHEGLWQFIKFSLVSSLAGITETVSFFLLSTLLGTRLTADFDFFVFHYTAEKQLNLGLFIAFFASAILAEIVSFLVNRKATFHANNNFWRSAVMYLLLVLAVISLKTWIVTVLTPWVGGWTQNRLLIEWIPKAVSMLIAMAIIFPMNKFVIMRRTETPPADDAAASV